MDKKQITERASQLETTIHNFQRMRFMAPDDSGLSPTQRYALWMMATLNDGRPVMPSEAAKKLNVTVAAITHQINSLDEQDLIVRTVSPDDRRVVLISLSDKGAEIVAKLRLSYWKKICGLVEHLGDEDSAELIRLMGKISDFVETKAKRGGCKC